MNVSLTAPTPLQYFATLVESDQAFPLLEAAISLAQDEYPALDVQQVLSEVDQLLERLKRRIPADAAPLHRLRVLNQFFFHDLDFGGNLNDYYDPDNSYINKLLRSRRGIPISLAVLWLELAQGLGLKVAGVGFPGHFMVKVHLPKGQVVIDPFSGLSLGEGELLERLESLHPAERSPQDAAALLGSWLGPARPRDIIARMLRNLKEIFRTRSDWPRMLAVQERLVVLLPQVWSEYRDRGLMHAEVGNIQQALVDLECYLLHTDNSADVNAIADRVQELRRAT